MTENKRQVYILSLEASDIFSHMYRDTNINYDYCGMIPYSLELIKLRKEGLKTRYIQNRDKEISMDIINVKFNQKVKSGLELKKILKPNKDRINKEINVLTNNGGSKGEIEKKISYRNNIRNLMKRINKEKQHPIWSETTVDELRKSLYIDGFVLNQIDRKTGETKVVEYVVYKRSSSKSRTGQCLFIKKSLYNKMIKWSRMGLPFRKNMKVDLAGLLAYESLVGSSLEDTIKINPDQILIVDDVDSKFNQICNVVRTGDERLLNSYKENVTVSNSLFDGESLLDENYFEEGVSMKLLRNHMFKSASFNCKIQKYLQDNCPKDTHYNSWVLKDMFNNDIYAKDVALIITPSSLKALKFSGVLGEEKNMWDYWKLKVKEDDNLFGVCKHEKHSKLGFDEKGDILQQTSYQMINCLPIVQNDIEELTKTEKLYIERLKNDDAFFVDKIKENATMINSNEMLADLYDINRDIINTKLFRDFRKGFIKGHVNRTKKGKIKLNGDYCVMLGNPMEFLKHAIGQLNLSDVGSLSLIDNEIHTTLFEFNHEYVGFRNPNTSPSNVLIVKNKFVEDIHKYFNLTNNIVCVNAIKFPIQDILSGCDYDSDTVLLLNNNKILELGKKCFGNYQVCINDVESQKKQYRLNKKDMFEIDNQLSTSQRNIGKVVNLGQFCMSVYWHLINNNESGDHVDELLKKVDVMTVLSGIAIDMAKKFYEIDIDREICNVHKNEQLKKRKNKPMFWEHVSQSKTIKNRIEEYDCPMDFLIKELNKIPQAERKSNIEFKKILIEKEDVNYNQKQVNKIISLVDETDNLLKSENAKLIDKEERFTNIEDIMKDCFDKIQKIKINENTMYEIIKETSQSNTKIFMKLLHILHKTHKENFLKCFKNGHIGLKSYL